MFSQCPSDRTLCVFTFMSQLFVSVQTLTRCLTFGLLKYRQAIFAFKPLSVLAILKRQRSSSVRMAVTKMAELVFWRSLHIFSCTLFLNGCMHQRKVRRWTKTIPYRLLLSPAPKIQVLLRYYCSDLQA